MKTQREYIDILSKNAKKIREDFGIKSTKLGLAYDKTIFRVDSAGYLTDIN